MKRTDGMDGRAATVGDRLRTSHPLAFGDPPKPLKTGIHEDLLAAHPGIDRAALRSFLQAWTTGLPYLRSLAAGGPRVALDGRPFGEVLPWHAMHARWSLGDRTVPLRSRRPPGHDRSHPAYVRACGIRDRHPVGTDLVDGELSFMIGLLGQHPAGPAKTSGVTGIRIVVDGVGRNAFATVREDGHVERFSAAKCLLGLVGRARPTAPPDP